MSYASVVRWKIVGTNIAWVVGTMNTRKRVKRICAGAIGRSRTRSGRVPIGLLSGFFLFALALSSAGAQPSGLRIVSSANKTTSLSQHGITWYFDTEIEYGQFVNGDYWVVGPVVITRITPRSLSEDGRVRHGAMLNPSFGETQGFDSHTLRNSYSAENNVARPGGNDLSPNNPLVIDGTASLVSVISHPEPNRRPSYTDAAVLTVVNDVPPEGTFRPSYSGETKYWFSENDIDWDLLESHQVSRANIGSEPNLNAIAGNLERVWLDYRGGNWTARKIHPSNNMPDYGRDMAKQLGDAALALLLDYPRERKRTLMIRFLQIGLDWWGTVEDQGGTARIYNADGGHGLGRKWPILFAGLMFGDDEILKFANGEEYHIFQEDIQTNYVDQDLINCSQDSNCWSPDTRNRNYAPYDNSMLGLPEWGIRYNNNYSRNDSDWGALYRMINSAGTTPAALAAIIMNAKESWNWPAFFDYHDRFAQAGRDGEHSFWGPGGTNNITTLTYQMWEAFRADYAPVWSE